MFLRLFTENPFTEPVLQAPLLVTIFRVMVVGASLMALIALVQRRRDLSPHHLALEYGLVIVAMLLVSPLSEDLHYAYLALPVVAILAMGVTSRPVTRRAVLLGLGVAAVYSYLSLPKLHALKMANYAFYEAPVAMPQLLLTGMHVYGLCALAVLTVLTIRWSRNRTDAMTPALSPAATVPHEARSDAV